MEVLIFLGIEVLIIPPIITFKIEEETPVTTTVSDSVNQDISTAKGSCKPVRLDCL